MSPQDNPFHPPNAHSTRATPRRGSPILAVFVGVLADIGGSLFVGVLMVIVFSAVLITEGTPPEQVGAVLENVDPTSWFSIAGYLIGSVFSFLGGYLCARIARYTEYRLAGVVAVIATTFGLLLGGGRVSIALNVFLALLSVGSVMAGAWRGAVRNRVARES